MPHTASLTRVPGMLSVLPTSAHLEITKQVLTFQTDDAQILNIELPFQSSGKLNTIVSPMQERSTPVTSLTWCGFGRESGNLSRCCRSPPYRRRTRCLWCERLQDTWRPSLTSLDFGVLCRAVSGGKHTGNLDPFARRTAADQLAVVAYIVATVETSHARAHGVLPSLAFLYGLQVAVWKNHSESF